MFLKADGQNLRHSRTAGKKENKTKRDKKVKEEGKGTLETAVSSWFPSARSSRRPVRCGKSERQCSTRTGQYFTTHSHRSPTTAAPESDASARETRAGATLTKRWRGLWRLLCSIRHKHWHYHTNEKATLNVRGWAWKKTSCLWT